MTIRRSIRRILVMMGQIQNSLGPLASLEAPEPKDDPALILLDHPQAGREKEYQNESDHANEQGGNEIRELQLLAHRVYMHSRSGENALGTRSISDPPTGGPRQFSGRFHGALGSMTRVRPRIPTTRLC